MPRRLCMVVHGPYPIGEPRVARQARTAVEAGYDVDVVAMRRDGEPELEVLDGIRVVRLPFAHVRGGSALQLVREYVGFTLAATLRVARLSSQRRYDVVQVHNPPDFLIASALLPKALGARIVLDVHDLAPDMFSARFEGRRFAGTADRALRLIERVATALAHSVLTVHQPYADELAARGTPARKVTVVMNTLDERLQPATVEPRRGNSFRIVYHGTASPWYGLELLVDALAQILPSVPNAMLEIYGEGDALPSARARAAELGVADRVSASGAYLPHGEVLERVQGASVGVIPNLPTRLNRFALSSKLFEYVALGVPVVCADLPTLRAHFADDEVRFFAAGDAGSLADALLDVAADPAEAERRVEAAAVRYEAYRWPINAARYLAVLDGETARGRREPSGVPECAA